MALYSIIFILFTLIVRQLEALPSSASRSLQGRAVKRQDASSYAPSPATCPDGPLARSADGIGPQESTYVNGRSTKAADALKMWLSKTDPTFGQPSAYPTLALTSSGGGLRAMLTGAGVHQAFDNRDSDTSVSGLYQALTYESGLSGGSWLLGSLAASNWAKVSQLQTNLWRDSLNNGILLPENIGAVANDLDIIESVRAKDVAGFDPTLVDVWGRLQGYAFLQGPEGGLVDTWSGVAQGSNFTAQGVPFPIITAIQTLGETGQCWPSNSSAIFELSPYEFGSWDTGVANFSPMQYIGSSNGHCVTGFDRITYVTGTSSDLLNQIFQGLPPDATQTVQDIINAIRGLLDLGSQPVCKGVLAPYPNPFASQPSSLYLVDGGETFQNNPIWPFLHRQVDVLFVNDNSNDQDNFPNGDEIHQTYMQAQANGLTRMPLIPESAVFVAQGLNTKPTFFGCKDDSVMSIIFLPNHQYTFNSGTSTFKLQYDPDDTDAMIRNGNAVATNNGDAAFGKCVGCVVMKKTGTTLPEACQQCFTDYCYN